MNLLKEFDVKSSNYSTAYEYINVKQHEDDDDEGPEKKPTAEDKKDAAASEYDNVSRGGDRTVTISEKMEPLAELPVPHTTPDDKHKKFNLKGDRGSIVLLTFLYLLQGIPTGLSMSIPLILSSRRVSYSDQGTFSFALWPYSIKLIWAPLVDALFIKKIGPFNVGRRKTWLVPVQYLIGIFMFTFASYVQSTLDSKEGSSSDIVNLAIIFFIFNMLATIQDVAVDGWALNLLSPENVSWASTCNGIGSTAGWFIGNAFFLIFESAEFSNRFIRSLVGLPPQTYGVINVQKFMYFFGFFYLILTTVVLFFIKEKHEDHIESKNFKILGTYKLLWHMVKLKPIQLFMCIFLTVRIGLGADGLATLKLIEAGMPRDRIGVLFIPLLPLLVILPIFISKTTNGPRPLSFLSLGIQLKYLGMVIMAVFVYFTPNFMNEDKTFPYYFYVIYLLISAYNGIFYFSCSIAQGAFFNRISDEDVGGTYMTFTNTVNNFGSVWPGTASLFLVNYITFKKCVVRGKALETGSLVSNLTNSTLNDMTNFVTNSTLLSPKCSSKAELEACLKSGGTCYTEFEGYYLLVTLGVLFGIVWYFVANKKFVSLQSIPKSEWKVYKSKKKHPDADLPAETAA